MHDSLLNMPASTTNGFDQQQKIERENHAILLTTLKKTSIFLENYLFDDKNAVRNYFLNNDNEMLQIICPSSMSTLKSRKWYETIYSYRLIK